MWVVSIYIGIYSVKAAAGVVLVYSGDFLPVSSRELASDNNIIYRKADCRRVERNTRRSILPFDKDFRGFFGRHVCSRFGV